MEYLIQFFYGTIERWNNWIAYLEYENDKKEKQLITSETPIPKILPHIIFQSYDESNFPYNLTGGTRVKTENAQVNGWIQDFASFHVDVVQMIQKEQTLPDSPFMKKRYFQIQKQIHPDRGGSTSEATQLNLAKENLDRLYDDPIEQITLFQTIFQLPVRPVGTLVNSPEIAKPQETSRSSAPYIILYLVGAGLGIILVLKTQKKKR